MNYSGFKNEKHYDRISVYNGDCMELLRQTPDTYYDLCIVDPPYGIGQPKQGNLKGFNGRDCLEMRLQKNRLNIGSGKLKNRVLNKSNCSWDDEIPEKDYFDELFRISKNQIIWGYNYFHLPPTRCFFCWDKVQPWENFSQAELAWTSFDSPAQLFKYDNRTGDKIHPTQKPVALYEYLIRKYVNQNDKILDTHLGSGSIVIAVDKANTFDNMNLTFTGIELDEEYYYAATERFEKHKSQGVLEF